MTKKELAALKDLREKLDMAICKFSPTPSLGDVDPVRDACRDVANERGMGGNWPAVDEVFTEYVRNGTRIWRQSWILPVLDEIIAKYDKGIRA